MPPLAAVFVNQDLPLVAKGPSGRFSNPFWAAKARPPSVRFGPVWQLTAPLVAFLATKGTFCPSTIFGHQGPFLMSRNPSGQQGPS